MHIILSLLFRTCWQYNIFILKYHIMFFIHNFRFIVWLYKYIYNVGIYYIMLFHIFCTYACLPNSSPPFFVIVIFGTHNAIIIVIHNNYTLLRVPIFTLSPFVPFVCWIQNYSHFIIRKYPICYHLFSYITLVLYYTKSDIANPHNPFDIIPFI